MTRIKVKGEGPPSAEAVLASRKLMASPESLPKPVSPSPQQSVVDLSALQMPGALSLLLGGRAEQLVASPEASSIAGLGRLDANTSASTKQPASVTAQSAAANMNNALKALACGASSMVHPTSSSQLEEIRLQQERDLKIQQFLCLQSQARNRELLMGLLNQVS